MKGGLLIKFLAWSIALGIVALPIIGVLSGHFAADRWPVRSLQLKAEFAHVDADQIRGAIADEAGKGFFALDLKRVRAAVMSLPWVGRVDASKHWPDTLQLTVFEQLPYARWGNDRLVTTSGDLFSVPDISVAQGLPQLNGPDDRVADVLAFHVRCLRQFSGSGLVVREVRLSGRGGWQVLLANDVVIDVGSEETDSRLERLTAVWPQIAAGHAAPAAIDLRYENGFSVRWNDAAAPTSTPAGATPTTPVNKA
ncbi:MAG: cell division protein FtsQ/DivIB [Dokdonella sp.]